uniref:Uncharacterized protein n=1 Tax=Yamagishiella unicocca TaxID=51707 RepID=A0A2Z5X886_9CHLO|nr:hypothetical protein [Yamagishiella unicocca]BBC28452.1 hypothetical protein [Yamagishiella unicocca]
MGDESGRDEGVSQRSDAEAAAALFGHRPEDALAPYLDSLRANRGDPMYTAFSAQMNNLYQVFKELYDQDQVEIRKLLTALESQKQQLHHLAVENTNVRQHVVREREHGAAAAAAAAAALAAHSGREAAGRAAAVAVTAAATQTEAMDRQRGQPLQERRPGPHPGAPDDWLLDASPDSGLMPDRRGMRPGGGSRMGGGMLDASRLGGSRGGIQAGRRGQRPFYIVFLPYMLHPAHQCWRFYAAWQYSWTTRRTLWLAMAWVLVFLLAVGLLVGLLVPWGRLSNTDFTVRPEVVAVGAAQVSLVMRLNRDAMVFYAVVPAAYTVGAPAGGSRRLALATGSGPLAGDDVSGAPWLRPWREWRRQWRLQPGQRRPCRYRRGLAAEIPQALRLDLVEDDDVRGVASGYSSAVSGLLYPYTVACGVLDVAPQAGEANYTLTLRSVLPLVQAGSGPGAAPAAPDECTGSYGLTLNSTLPLSNGPFNLQRCQRCPLLQPGTTYIVLILGDGGRSTGVVQVNFTTTANPAPVAAAV